VVLVAVGVVALVAARVLGIVSWRRAIGAARYGLLRKHRTLARMGLLNRVGTQLRDAPSLEEIREILRGLSLELDVEGMSCRVDIHQPGRSEPEQHYEWEWSGPGAAAARSHEAERVELRFALDEREGDVTLSGTLAFWWGCPSLLLQMPERPFYEWLAVLLRRRVVALCGREDASREARAS